MTDPCPECAQGKHANCDGTAWDDDLDDLTVCPCADTGHPDSEDHEGSEA